jgi:hypothetical protein
MLADSAQLPDRLVRSASFRRIGRQLHEHRRPRPPANFSLKFRIEPADLIGDDVRYGVGLTLSWGRVSRSPLGVKKSRSESSERGQRREPAKRCGVWRAI